MKAEDVTQVVELALTASGCDQAQYGPRTTAIAASSASAAAVFIRIDRWSAVSIRWRDGFHQMARNRSAT